MELFRTKKDTYRVLIIGLSIAIIYKIWKIFLREVIGVDPNIESTAFQIYCSFYRILGLGIALVICKKYIKDFAEQSAITMNKATFVLVGFLITYAILQFSINGFYTSFFRIIFEVPNNFFVGFYEEFVFRALILTALMALLKFEKAAVVCSLIFIAWHYDVYTKVSDYVITFIWSLVVCYAYKLRVSIWILSFFHAAWDLIYFGLVRYGHPERENFYLICLFIAQIVFLFIYLYEDFLLKKKATTLT